MTRILQKTREPFFESGIIDRLPKVRGKLSPNAPIGQTTWFGVGGPAEVLFRPEDKDDLAAFIKNCPKDIPVTMLGVASNMIIRDGGVPGVVIRLGRGFTNIDIRGTEVRAGAGAMDMNVALACLNSSIAGLEFLSGIPGTIGGALRMNAGAYGHEIKDILVSAEVMGRSGEIQNLSAAQMGMEYRHNALPRDVIFLGCLLKGQPGNAEEIKKTISDIKKKRTETQPIKSRTGGSTFANPDGQKSWKLIDDAGCRGLSIGGAQMSEMHCNFMINTGGATAADLERLGEEVRKHVYEKSGIMLRWEIRRIGIPLEKDADISELIRKETD